MLEDSYGRKFSYLRLSITDVCNFSCNYCLPNGYQCDSKPDFLSLNEIKHAVAAFANQGIEKIRITGGEPSLRRDLPEIIAQVKSTPGIKKVAITTNGHQILKKLPSWVDAGLDALNVSIDSLDPRMFSAITGRDSLDELLAGLDLAHQLGIKNIKVNSVLLKQYNASQFQTFLNWVKHTPISLRFIELMQTSDNLAFFQQNHLPASELKQQLLDQGWLPIIRDKSAGPAEEFCHPEYAGQLGFIAPYSKDFCASCNRLRLSAEGKMHLCLFAEAGNDIRHLMVAGKEAELESELSRLLQNKKATHYLQEGETGATKHFASIGG